MTVPTVTPRRLEELRAAGQPVELLDVRTPVEFREVHVPFARNLPLDRLDPVAVASSRSTPTGESLYVICKSGGRGQKACEKLLAAGVSAVNVEGGTSAWADAGLPVVRGKQVMSLERQVRLTAGLLVVLGALLGWLVHPAFVGLSAFVGGGLAFAGLTDTCAMGMLIARMPWNRVAGDAGRSNAPEVRA